MSKINFITGELHGRLGEIVGSRKNGTAYTKIYVPPSNPQTENQTRVRNTFSHIGHLGSQLTETVLKPFLFPKPAKRTELNQLIVLNNELLRSPSGWNPEHFHLADGPLTPENIAAVTVTGSSVKITWAKTGGADADAAVAVIYDDETRQAWSASGNINRGALEATVNCSVTDFSKAHAYLFFAEMQNGKPVANSKSTWKKVL